MSPEQVASAVVPLVVALFNLLVAGYALAAGQRDRGLYAFALGPAGVGLWALAWFIFVFNAESKPELRTVGAAGGVIAMLGYAGDALLGRPRAEASRWLTGAALAMLTLGVAAGLAPLQDPLGVGLRGAALLAGALTLGLRAREWRAGIGAPFARWVVVSALLTGAACLALAGLAYAGERAFVDVLLFIMLWAELLALGYVVHRRIEVRVLVTRLISWGLLAGGVAGAAALIFARLGYPVDPVVVTVTVSVALATSAAFMGLSGRLTVLIERVLFPEQARLARDLETSRGELVALRRRLDRAEKLAIAGELAASVAHEIKNPLAPIKGYAQMLEDRLSAVSEADRAFFQKALRIVREESDRIDHRVAELLALARGERKSDGRVVSLELNRLVADAVAVAEAEPGLGKIVQRLDPRIGRVSCDEDQLRGALLNLMKNAAEAMREGGGSTIEVATYAGEGRAVIEVIDEGPGVDPAVAERAFSPFYTTKEGGTGLGLAIARSAVEAAGGEITMRARQDRRGAVVAIELPVTKGDGP